MVILGGVLILGAAAWMLALYLNGPKAGPKEAQEATISVEGLPRVSLADARAAFDTGAAVFVDVRDAQAYAQAHIPGALSIPLAELPQRVGELNPSAWIITY